MLIIGSTALEFWGFNREVKDTDYIGTFEEFRSWSKALDPKSLAICAPLSEKKWHVRTKEGWNFEWEIAWPGSSGEALLEHCKGKIYAPLDVCLALKLSHRYLKNSPHFLKTMRDIQALREKGVTLTPWLEEWLPWREKETYVYNHPKLDVTKEQFFAGDGVNYVYDHDSIHLTQAAYADDSGGMMPAYTFYMRDGSEVMTSKEKFFAIPERFRLLGVYEETCVLALERSQIPNDFKIDPRKSFEIALMKVCTSITSGWFREYAWENYNKVVALYEQLGENDYVERFQRNAHLLKPFKEVV
tara:strand:+ start:716 stop:1618 length:903 start_codon:yes stop_codon:yes gene_type:complete